MKIKYVIIFLICILFIPRPAFAMNFVPETLYNSVTVVYTNKGLGSGFAIEKIQSSRMPMWLRVLALLL